MPVTYTYCQLCEQTCGLAVKTEQGKVTEVMPDKDNPFSWRDFCVKAGASHLSLEHPERITSPMRRVGDQYVKATYEEAIEDISRRLLAITKAHGADAVASYGGNPSSFNFGGSSFFSLLMNGIGSRNKYWVGSIDQNGLHVALRDMLGAPFAILHTDIDRSDYMLFIGSNPKISGMNWLGHLPDGWKRALQAQKRGAKITIVDPRKTESAEKADLHISPIPGTDWALVLGLIKVIVEEDLGRSRYADRLTGLAEIKALASSVELANIAAFCDIDEEQIQQVAREFAAARRGFAVARTGVAQTLGGSVGLWLTLVLNFLTDHIETEGGLYYQHKTVTDLIRMTNDMLPDAVTHSRLKKSESVVGYLPLAELADEITTPGKGQVKALIIHAGNPVVSGPDGRALDQALSQLDLLVAVDLFQRESHRHADWLIPGEHFLEREEINVLIQSTHPVPYVQTARRAVDPPDSLIPEWRFFYRLALKMNLPIVKSRVFNPLLRLSGILARMLRKPYLEFSPQLMERMLVAKGKRFRFKDILAADHGLGNPQERPAFGALFDRIGFADNRVRLAPDNFLARARELVQHINGAGQSETAQADVLHLISRRRMHMMNSWLVETSMTMMKNAQGDQIYLNKDDCARLRVGSGERVNVQSETGSLEAVVQITPDVRPGVAVMEYGWGNRRFNPCTGKAAEQRGVNSNSLVSRTELDPLSGVPALNGSRIRILKMAV